jgi:hypothetical protein
MSFFNETQGSSTSNTSSPFQNQLWGWGQGVANNQAAWAPNTASQVTPFANQTVWGMNGMQQAATQSAPSMNQNYANINNTVNDGGLNSLQDQQVGRLQGIAGGNGLNTQQQQAYNGLNAFSQGNGLNTQQQQAYNQYSPMAQGNGLNSMQQWAYNQLNPMAQGNGLNNMQQAAYNRLDPTAAGNGFNATQQNAANYLSPIASGASRQNNPYLEDMIKRGSQDIGNAQNLMASSAGRYGSDSHAGRLGKEIGDFAGNTRFTDYNNQNARQDNAINSLFGMGTTGAGQKNEAINQQYGIGTQGFGQKTNAINAQYGIGSQGAAQKANAINAQYGIGTQGAAQKSGATNQQFGMGTTGMDQRNDAISSLYNAGTAQRQNIINGTQQLQDAYQARMDPYRTLMGVGAMNEGLYGRQIADNTRIFNEKQKSARAPLDWLSQFAGNGNTTTTNTQPAQASGLSQGLGGALTGFAAGGPLGGLLGGLAGLI